MKFTRQHLTWAVMALLLVAAIFAVMGHPPTQYLPASMLAALGAIGGAPLFLGETSLVEIKDLVEKQGTTWEQYQKANDERIAKLAKGESVEALEAKLAKMETELTAAGKELKEVSLKAQRPNLSSEKTDAAEKELKSFNLRLKAAAMESGKSHTDLTGEQYADYKAAYDKLIRKGAESLSEVEKKTINVGTSTQGGFLIDFQMESGIDRVVHRYSGVRQVARVIPIGSASYKKLVKVSGTAGGTRTGETGVPSNGTSPGWVELEFKPGTFVSEQRITSEALEDATQDVGADLEMEIGIEFAEMEGGDFVTGDGTNGPRGMQTYGTVANANYAWGSVGYIAGGHASLLNASDPLIDLVHGLKRQYRPNASWLMNDATLGSIRKLKDGQGNYLWGMTKESFTAGAVGTLLGYPVVTDDFMPDIAANALPISFGDFQRAYYVVDRKGIAILRDPATAFPAVRFLARRRVGGGIANFEALKHFKIATS